MNKKAGLPSGHGDVRKYYCWKVAPLQSLLPLISAFTIYWFFPLFPPTIFGNITHLYIIDNSVSITTDQLLVELSVLYPIPAYTHIKNDSNVGVAAANNQGMHLSMQQGDDFVLLLENDIAFQQTFLLERLVNYSTERKHSSRSLYTG